MKINTSTSKSPLSFCLLVFIISIPFWLLGAVAGDLTQIIPVNLPISSLMVVCPISAALILTYRDHKSRGVQQLLGRVFDYQRASHKLWYLPVIFLMPIIMVLSYAFMRLIGLPLPEPHLPFLSIPVFLLVFFISTIGEEIGWSGYALDPLQTRWGALKASLILGSVWAIWHVLPYIQAHNTPEWIVWECLATVGLRVIMVWLYNNMGKSLFAAILFHVTIDMGWVLFPNYGSHYNPAVTGIIILITAVIITFLWGPKTLTQYKFSRLRLRKKLTRVESNQ
ncbi:MAG: CPBP family intramembrane glutamic endopeptidase [Chloroflexota bacterium]|nr:CPBP family intramembrane metalloprotease [Anaerolineae bacterium]